MKESKRKNSLRTFSSFPFNDERKPEYNLMVISEPDRQSFTILLISCTLLSISANQLFALIDFSQ